MKKYFCLFLLVFLPAVLSAGERGLGSMEEEYTCSPVKNGKICYSDDVSLRTISKGRLFAIINAWAHDNYGTDFVYSNVSANKNKGSILISSKVELWLSERESTMMKFRVRIQCYDNRYTIDISDISYQYNPTKARSVKSYPAESVILNEGKGNRVDIIKNPLLFCEATYYFADKLMGLIYDEVK
ncbi:hypothetical protein M2137_002245 [Parabacteroides sp. PFB2-10]|uniref:DUF4468 domain-containing protein n=1 Tax=Parabacteroides sp. PFB2-10 TaxID=1742405 RepID=UPI0024770A5C|nr:DUF4468 domain-containing protein [Parabacteroides sp. PFB2-10]MDH6313455.1 hypothetical protein [Parabacteroides sp. PFB2-10]MDL2245746.1 DUF4468 domain-containing protein [Parabacteroides sp. OttesenSCG-928-J18]